MILAVQSVKIEQEPCPHDVVVVVVVAFVVVIVVIVVVDVAVVDDAVVVVGKNQRPGVKKWAQSNFNLSKPRLNLKFNLIVPLSVCLILLYFWTQAQLLLFCCSKSLIGFRRVGISQ